MDELTNYLGAAHPSIYGAYLDDAEPATRRVYAKVPDSDAADLDLAVAAAERAWLAWKAQRHWRSGCVPPNGHVITNRAYDTFRVALPES
jgi:acyl-CoA reductase-like NAD-dependent aldehyde dehydrogenase